MHNDAAAAAAAAAILVVLCCGADYPLCCILDALYMHILLVGGGAVGVNQWVREAQQR